MIELNAKGLFCPEPLMMVLATIKEHPGEDIMVEVDTVPPSENIVRLAKREGYFVETEKKEDGVIALTLRKG